MKKRDYYFLALLLCMIIYATLHRSWNNHPEKISSEEIQETHANTEIQPVSTDSVKNNKGKVIKAGA